MKLILTLFLVILINVNSYASHNLGGAITYNHISGFTYEVQITTYTDIGPNAGADRNSLYLNWGDGLIDSLDRISQVVLPYSMAKNIYTGIHTYSNFGQYTLSTSDPNRANNFENLNNGASDNIVFYIESELYISQNNDFNNSIQFVAPYFYYSGIDVPFSQNISAFDPDGDNLTFEIVQTKGVGGGDIPFSILQNISISEKSGQITWDDPSIIGKFIVSVRITECRNNEKIGSVLLDIPIYVDGSSAYPDIVFPDATTWPQDITDNYIYSINPNDSIDLNVAVETNIGTLDIEAYGEPFILPNNGVFTTDSLASDFVRKNFKWVPNASNIRCAPYIVTFRSKTTTPEFNQDISLLIYLRDSLTTNCDVTCDFSVSNNNYLKPKNDLTIAPNPFKSQTMITFNGRGDLSTSEFIIYSMSGRELLSIPILGAKELILFRNNLSPGIYLYSINNMGERSSSGKLIITK